MNVSFDGLRTNATRSMNVLHDEVKKILHVDSYDDISDIQKSDLIKSFNEAAMFVDTFNCLYDDDVEDDMNNMENLSIDRLIELDEDESRE